MIYDKYYITGWKSGISSLFVTMYWVKKSGCHGCCGPKLFSYLDFPLIFSRFPPNLSSAWDNIVWPQHHRCDSLFVLYLMDNLFVKISKKQAMAMAMAKSYQEEGLIQTNIVSERHMLFVTDTSCLWQTRSVCDRKRLSVTDIWLPYWNLSL